MTVYICDITAFVSYLVGLMYWIAADSELRQKVLVLVLRCMVLVLVLIKKVLVISMASSLTLLVGILTYLALRFSGPWQENG